MRRLKDKVFIVTGAGSGIGAATALRLMAENAKVTAADINAEGLAKTAAAANGYRNSILTVTFDLKDEASIVALVATAAKHFGRIDGVANVAADVSPNAMHEDIEVGTFDPSFWMNAMHTNWLGTGIVIRESLPHIVAAGGGSIVNISSAGAWMGEAVRPAYASSKIALHALTRHTARAWGRKNIRCNAIAPGLVLTEAAATAVSQEYNDAVLAKGCMPRLGRPEDVAATIAFLLSDDAEWTTGQILSVDGGLMFRE